MNQPIDFTAIAAGLLNNTKEAKAKHRAGIEALQISLKRSQQNKTMEILTPLSEYAKQFGLSRQRIYQLKDRLPIVMADVKTVCTYGQVQTIENTLQLMVVQNIEDIKARLRELQMQVTDDMLLPDIKRRASMIQAIEDILK